MKNNIRGDKLEVTKAIKEHIEGKLAKLDRYFENPETITAGVIIRVRNGEQIIEVTVPTTRFTLRAEESHKDLYAAVDLVIDKLERQIRKNKTRLSNKYEALDDFEINLEIDFDDEEEQNEEKIVKRKNIEMKPMDEEEAILQMELLNHDFFVFKNIDEECVSVLYLRNDGSYGIINVK